MHVFVEGKWFNLRNSVITSVLVVSGGFLFALMLVTIDPSLNKQAPPQKPHGFWQSGKYLDVEGFFRQRRGLIIDPPPPPPPFFKTSPTQG